MTTLGATCLCGDVAWEGEAPVELAHHCHCSMCRRTHGTLYATFAGVAARSFRFVRGEAGTDAYRSSAGNRRRFCSRCGSSLPGGMPWNERIFVPLGPLDADPGARPAGHLFVGSKAPWHEIGDELPRQEALPVGMAAPVVPERAPVTPAAGCVTGSCLCGSIAFQYELPFSDYRHCHCSRCRRARAAAHASNLFGPLTRFRWLRGQEHLAAYKVPEADRFAQAFCRICGSALPRVNEAMGIVVVPAGSLDVDPGLRPSMHIFVASKAPWHEIHDELPQHAEYPPV